MQSPGSSSLGKYNSAVFLHEVSVAFFKFMGGNRQKFPRVSNQVTLASKVITWIHSWIKKVGIIYMINDIKSRIFKFRVIILKPLYWSYLYLPFLDLHLMTEREKKAQYGTQKAQQFIFIISLCYWGR